MRRQSYARSVRSGETKYFDVGINTTVTFAGTSWADSEVPADNYVNSSGTTAAYTDSCLIPTANGSAYGQVDGNKYHLKALRVKGALKISSATASTVAFVPAQVRMLLVMDTQPNGAQAQGEDVMQDVGEAQENIHTFSRVAANLGRFRILKDKTYIINPAVSANDTTASSVSTAYNMQKFKLNYKPIVPLPITIKSGNSTPTVGGTVNCNIFLLLAAERNVAATGCTIYAASRAYYVD